MLTVDVGIACNKNQSNRWWSQVMGELLNIQERGQVRIGRVITVGAALPDFSKSEVAAIGLGRLGLTDANRSEIVQRHLEEDEKAGAIWWIDDDTVPPAGALEKLVAMDVEVAAGLYFLRVPPCSPVAYFRNPGGTYAPLWNYQRGEIVHVDSVGMGCTLVRRTVYERIKREYLLFQRVETGTVRAVHRDDFIVVKELPKTMERRAGQVVYADGQAVYVEKLIGPLDPKTVERWPFYAMEYERTEDHYFCEMVKRLGMTIAVDTSIECQHWGDTAVVGQNFRDMKQWYEQREKKADGDGQE